MDRRVAHVDADRAPSVLALHGGDALARLVQSRVPGDRTPPTALPPLRFENAIRISLHVGNCGCLGTDVPAAEGIVRIAADAADRSSLYLDREAADRLAEHAGVEANRHGGISGG